MSVEEKAVEFTKWMSEQSIEGADSHVVQIMAKFWLDRAKQVFEG